MWRWRWDPASVIVGLVVAGLDPTKVSILTRADVVVLKTLQYALDFDGEYGRWIVDGWYMLIQRLGEKRRL